MKYTKDEAYKELVAKMTEKGEKLSISERSINSMLDNLMTMMQNDETELAEFVEKVLPVFKTANANVRNDVSVGIKNYINDKKSEEEDTKQEPQKEKKDDEILLERLKKMEETLASFEAERTKKDLMGKLVSILKEKGVKDEKWIDALLSEVTIDCDMDMESKAETYLNLYNISRATIDQSDTPTKPDMNATNDSKLEERMKKAADFAKSQNLIS